MKILNISTHSELLVVGTAYLRALGFQADGVCDLAGLRALFGMGKQVDLVILCHTLDNDQKRSICESINGRIPLTQVVELYLTRPPVTHGIPVHATTEFQPLMRMLAECLAQVNVA